MSDPSTPAPRLRAGLHVVRRDDRHLQIGVDPPWRVIAPDEPEVRRLLDDLGAGRPAEPVTPAAHRTLLALHRAGMLVEQPEQPRRDRSVAVRAHAGLQAELGHLLRAAGCVPVSAGSPARVALVAAPGELRRSDLDPLVRSGQAHLLVSAGPRGWTLGPFVQPGVSACVRCVDAHRGEHDPRRALVVDQLAQLVTAPDDPALRTLALAWAVRDVLTHLDGAEPSTWSASVTIGSDLHPARRTWARHPHCGCAWTI